MATIDLIQERIRVIAMRKLDARVTDALFAARTLANTIAQQNPDFRTQAGRTIQMELSLLVSELRAGLLPVVEAEAMRKFLEAAELMLEERGNGV